MAGPQLAEEFLEPLQGGGAVLSDGLVYAAQLLLKARAVGALRQVVHGQLIKHESDRHSLNFTGGAASFG